jgi:pimeloyl-ACP methyl ester carboxylesterase
MTQEAPQSSYEEAYVDVNGARVHYLHAGIGPPMLLIHGLVGSSENWRNNIAALAQNASVYAIDLVNNGKSQRIDGLDVSLRATANRIVAIMDALGLAAADIVAHSHGGSVALMLAALYPTRVHRLILFAPANPYSRASDRMVRVYSSPFGIVLGRLIPYFPAPVQRLALGEVYGSPDRVADHSLQEIVDGLRCPATLRHVLSIIRCWFSEMDRLRYALRRVARTPTILLVWGDHDGTVSLASGVRLKRKLRAKLIVVPGGLHTVFEERPEEANQIMLDWFARHPLTALLGPAGHVSLVSRPRRVSRIAAKSTAAPAMRSLSPEPSGD